MDGFSGAPAPHLTRMKAGDAFAAQLAVLRTEGVLILEDAVAPELLARLRSEMSPWFDRCPGGEGRFFGRATKRFSAVMCKSPAAVELLLHERVLALCERVLIADDIGPARCERVQLNLTQAIGIGPGEPEQVVHRDQQLFWVDPGYELLINAMFCLDDFTAENGGTRFAPGSSHWDRDRWPLDHEVAIAEAPAGSVILWVGSMMHGGGANQSAAIRRGVIMSYNLAWLAQTEKLLLSSPPEIVRQLPVRAQELIGYQVHRPNLGWVEGRDPREWLNGAFADVAAAQDFLHADHAALLDFYYASRAAAGVS